MCSFPQPTAVSYRTAGTAQSFTHGFTQIKFNMIFILSDFYLFDEWNEDTSTQASSSVWTIYSTRLEYIAQCMLKLASRLWLKSNIVHVSHVKLQIHKITILDLELAADNRSAACGE